MWTVLNLRRKRGKRKKLAVSRELCTEDERFIEHVYGFLTVLERILEKKRVVDDASNLK